METKRDIERFIDEFKFGRLDRRTFNRGLASVGLGTMMMPLVPGAAAADPDDQPICYTWGGYEVPEMHGAYIDKHGESPRFSLWGDEEEAEAKLRAGFKPDVGMPCCAACRVWPRVPVTVVRFDPGGPYESAAALVISTIPSAQENP